VLNVYPTHHEGMRMTAVVMDRVILAVLLYQIVMLGVFSFKLFLPGTGVSAAIILTLFIWYYVNQVTYKPLKHVALLDLSKKKLNLHNTKHMDLVEKTYKHPALKPLQKPRYFKRRWSPQKHVSRRRASPIVLREDHSRAPTLK